MNLEQLKALCTMLVVCDDPTNPEPDIRKTLEDFANEQAKAHGFRDWVDAYMELPRC